MLKAFETKIEALRFCAVLVLCLALPILLDGIGRPPRAAVYAGISERAGPFIFTGHQLLGDSATIDIAFVGSSVMKVAIDADAVQARMVERFGPSVNVRILPFVFQGFDLQYALIRDLLERRRVKMLVTTFSGPHRLSGRPHAQLHRFLRYGDYRDAFGGLPLADRVAVYGSAVLGAPRQLVSLVRADRATVDTSSRRSLSYRVSGADPPGDPALALILGGDTTSAFVIPDGAITPREAYFARAIGELAARHQVKLVVLNIPVREDAESNRVWERADWRRLMPAGTTVVGFRPSALFPADRPVRRFYEDVVHLNDDGQSCMTRSLAPFLLEVYASLGHDR